MRRLMVLLFVLVAVPLPARALFHLIQVVEVYAQGGVQYVEVQMYSPNQPQNFVTGHGLIFFDAAGSEVGRFTAPNDVVSGANQASILFATGEAENFFGVAADFVLPAPHMNPAGGKVCFDTFDCFAWGGYTGPSVGVGTPFGVLQPGVAAHRRLDIAGSPSVLDALDDTNNCANDFVSGFPAARNNAGQIGTDDGDGIGFTDDNCPFFGNLDQKDTDLDGRGNACECGDQNGDGLNTVSDLVAINVAIFNPAVATPLCDANNDTSCNVSDIVAVNAEIFSPTSTSTCERQPVPGP